jgi:hypothetical protein
LLKCLVVKQHSTRSRRLLTTTALLGLSLGGPMMACTGIVPGSDASEKPGGESAGGECDIQTVMAKPENGCTNAGCHGAQFQGGLDLLSPGVEQRLAGARSTTDACGGEQLVDPADPDKSLILRLIDPERFKASPDQCSTLMPLGSTTGVSGEDLACFEGWVKQIAEGADPSTIPESTPFDPSPTESYLGKVKTIVNGESVTDDELAQVQGNPAALRALIEQWTTSPGFEQKMKSFLRTNLQQDVSAANLLQQFGNLRNAPLRRDLESSLEQSFVRTAWDIIESGRPFTEILTTRRWHVNTAVLMALAYLDTAPQELQADRHTFFRRPTIGLPTPPVSLEESVEARAWYLPALPAGCPTARRGQDVLLMFLGFVRCNDSVQRSAETPLTDADFLDWRPVSLEQGEPPRFYDLPTLRSATTVRLRQPRVGFFTTPAFFSNAETNDDNQFRVTTNQTLIVSLGEIISASDPTQPPRLDGLATDHAEPGTACYGCHLHLDPMRNYFANAFSTSYRRDTQPEAVTPAFGFFGETREGGDLQDFAETLAGHERFPRAWAQKLCYYANSQACDDKDPEFDRIVKAFIDSGYDFKKLFVELLSSPLVTGAELVDTYQSTEFMVSIARRQHLCQMLDRRLGQVDICGQAGLFADLVPADSYSRGSAVPVQPAVTGMFHFAAAEKLCVRLSTRLVGNVAASRFKTADVPGAIGDLVEDLMGLSPEHPRHDAIQVRLQAHYDAALQEPGSNPVQALRSTFTLACVSPDVMALGL